MKSVLAAAALAVAFAAAPVFSKTQTSAPASAPVEKSALDRLAFEAWVRHMLLWDERIAVKIADPKPAPMPGFVELTVNGSYNTISVDETFYVSSDGRKIVRGSVYDIKESPFQRELSLLKTDMQPSMGTPGAPVIIALFSDFQCNYCRDEAKTLRANLLTTFPKEVRLYFKDFPLDQIHPWARSASIAGRCVFRADPLAFWDYHDWIFDKQPEVTLENFRPKFMEWAQAKGLDTLQLGRCLDTRATEPEIQRNVAEARSLKINSTPTLFINGRPIPGSVQWPQLKAIIEWELKQAQKTGLAAEKCCEVSLPTPAPAKK